MRNQVLIGDCVTLMKTLPEKSVQCCVTSPPYWGQRDYNVRGQIGLEDRPEAFVETLVRAFEEVHRVLRDDGVLWVNLGDSYFAATLITATKRRKIDGHPFLKEKDLTGIPWRFAFAMQEWGWYLRTDIVWAKDAIMPESVRDRPTRAHEYIFMFTKKPQYFYDAYAAREPVHSKRALTEEAQKETRNRRSVWRMNHKHYKGPHLAPFPEEIPEVCIKASTSQKGACPKCGAPWQRLLERSRVEAEEEIAGKWSEMFDKSSGKRLRANTTARRKQGTGDPNVIFPAPLMKGWEPTCTCGLAETTPCVVLDPFTGSGTTLAVARWLGCDYVGIELNPEYHPLIEERVREANEYQSQKSTFDLAMLLDDD